MNIERNTNAGRENAGRCLTILVCGLLLFTVGCTEALYQAGSEAAKKEPNNPIDQLITLITLLEILDPKQNAIQNVRNKGTVETGFLIGTARSTVTSVEVSLDGGAYAIADGTTAWRFKLPTGSSTWRDGTLHTIAVRWNGGTPTTLTVRKGANRDLNGDGYGDVIVMDPGYSAATGRAYIFHSSGSSGVTVSAASSASRIITGEANSGFGSNAALGDINGDGYADVAVGAGGYSSSAGRTYVFHSTGTAGVSITSAASASRIITGNPSSVFGSDVAIGDINGDGYADVVAGAYGGGAGTAYVFHSTGAAGVSITTAATASRVITGEAGSSFGRNLITGDVNGDAYADVVVGGANYSTGTGRVYVFHSTGAAGVSITASTSATRIITGEAINNSFGTSVAVGDVNGDGYGDILVGAIGYSSNTGRVYLFHSTGAAGITVTTALSANRIITGAAVNNTFGEHVTTADVNGDGFQDVIAGTNVSLIYIFNAGSGGVGVTAVASASHTISFQTGNRFITSDLNGDGYPDLISGDTGNPGRAFIFPSTGSAGIAITSTSSAHTIIGEGNNFGASSASREGPRSRQGFGDALRRGMLDREGKRSRYENKLI